MTMKKSEGTKDREGRREEGNKRKVESDWESRGHFLPVLLELVNKFS